MLLGTKGFWLEIASLKTDDGYWIVNTFYINATHKNTGTHYYHTEYPPNQLKIVLIITQPHEI